MKGRGTPGALGTKGKRDSLAKMNPFQTKDSNATQDATKKQARLRVQNMFGDSWGQREA